MCPGLVYDRSPESETSDEDSDRQEHARRRLHTGIEHPRPRRGRSVEPVAGNDAHAGRRPGTPDLVFATTSGGRALELDGDASQTPPPRSRFRPQGGHDRVVNGRASLSSPQTSSHALPPSPNPLRRTQSLFETIRRLRPSPERQDVSISFRAYFRAQFSALLILTMRLSRHQAGQNASGETLPESLVLEDISNNLVRSYVLAGRLP